MAGISATGGVSAAMSNLELQTQMSAQVASLQKDAIEMQGDMALQLIQSAATTTGVGQQLNIQV